MLQWNTEEALKLNVQMKAVEPTLEAGAQIQQLLTAECIEDYADSPTIDISFRYNGTQQKFSIKLPLTVNKFFEPTEMNAESFFARWKNLSGWVPTEIILRFQLNCNYSVFSEQQRSQKVFKAAQPLDLPGARNKLMGFGMQLLDQVDPNPDNMVCAGIIHTQSQQVGCLLRLEPNKQAQVSNPIQN